MSKASDLTSKGRLYIFEGADGVGKSTLIEELLKRLSEQGKDVISLSFPGQVSGSLGKFVYDIHHDNIDHGINEIDPLSLQVMHVASHIDCIHHQIEPALAQGKTILLDRYWWSTVAYGRSAGISIAILQTLKELELKVWDKIIPDQIFYIQVSKPFRKELSTAQWRKVTKNYLELVKAEGDSHPVHVIDNDGEVDEACQRISTFIVNEDFQDDDTRSSPLLPGFEASSSVVSTKRSKLNEWSPIKTTPVFDTYWKFAAERQSVFFARYNHCSPPWTEDGIIQTYKFTNAYRASDRVSQYLIKNIIYKGEQSPEEVFFRILLFKTFNKIETWEVLEKVFGTVSYSDFKFKHYDDVLTGLMRKNIRIYSAAYIMPSGGKALGHTVKHRNNLELLTRMMRDDVPSRISDSSGLQEVFELLLSYPTIGDFLAYQYATDINYSNIIDFSEMSFVVPGPGAKDGIRKCFSDYGGLTEVDLIKRVTDRQEVEFDRLGLDFQNLWGRPLQLIDCQNLFCEVDKYSRVAHPDIKGKTGRSKIKQKYTQTPEPINYFYPPKWGINNKIEGTQ